MPAAAPFTHTRNAHTTRIFLLGLVTPNIDSLTLLVLYLALAPCAAMPVFVPADAMPRFEEVSENENKCLYLNPYA